jgi:Secretion system C-terminal sorting domain
MKKNYTFNLLALVLLFLFSSKSYGQDMITGGNMENADDWATCALNTGADNTVTYEFNYTGDKPTAGVGGCLYVVGTNTGTGNGQGTNFMFYQQVTLQCGVPYTFDLAYKDVRTEKYWFEAYVGGPEPTVGSDYAAGTGIIKIGGWKWSGWETSCTSDEFDDTFVQTACIADGINPFTIEGTGDTTVYVGFRMGIWDDASGGLSFEVYVDNVSLTGPNSAVRNYTDPAKVNVFPNPASGKVTISNIKADHIQIFNLAGQEVLQSEAKHQVMSLDVSGLHKGMYLLKSGDSTAKLMIE